MKEVLFLRRHYRNLGVLCLLFFSGMAVISVYIAITGTPEGQSVYAVCLLLGIWSVFIALALWILLAYWRQSLMINDGQIIQKGIVSSRTVNFSEVIETRWRVIPAGGRVVLRSASQKIKVEFDNFEPEERRWLIRLFRSSLPQSVQRDWERFCLLVALPLLKNGVDFPLADSEVLVTRRRWDRYFLPVISISAVAGVLCAWQFLEPVSLLAPTPFILIWVMLRLATPSKGLRSQRIVKMPERGFLLFLLFWSAVAIVGIPTFNAFAPHLPHAPAWAVIGLVLWTAVLLVQAYRADRGRQQVQQPMAQSAAEEWKRLEGGQANLGGEDLNCS